jgi:hypothetical protein
MSARPQQVCAGALLLACVALTAWVPCAVAGSKPAHADKADVEAPADLGVNAYLGRDVLIVESPELDAFLSHVVQRLVDAASKPVKPPRVLIVSNDDYYAEADEYGNLLIYTGVLRRVQSESEIAAVLGHELGHVMLDHVRSRSSAKSLPAGIESLTALSIAAGQLHGGTAAPAASNGTSDFSSHGFYYSLGTSILLEDVLMPAFNRNQERDADRVAVDLLGPAGYDVGAMTPFLNKVGAARIERSKRLDTLKAVAQAEAKKKVATAQAQGKPTPASDPVAAGVDQALGAATAMASEKLSAALVDAIASRSVAYDPADVRIEAVLNTAPSIRVRRLPSARRTTHR